MSMARIKALSAHIEQIKEQLSQLGDMTPGTLTMQYNVCGNRKCRCKDPEKPIKHGPYPQLSFTRKGKSKTRFIKQHELDVVQKQIENYALFKKLCDEWIDASIELADLRRKEEVP